MPTPSTAFTLPCEIQTGAGKLIISTDQVTFVKPAMRGFMTETLARSAIVSVATRVVIKASFGRFGGLDEITINTIDGRQLVLKRVPHKHTATIVAILSPR